MTNKNVDNKSLELILKNAAISLTEKEEKIFDTLSNQDILNPKQSELDNRIAAMINTHFEKEQQKTKIKRVKKILAKAAVIMIIMSTGFLVSFTTVDAFRAKILNFYIENFDTHASFSPTEDNAVDSFSIDYVPNGYNLTDKYKASSFTTITYLNNDDKMIDITIYNYESTIGLDTEECKESIVTINNEKAYIYKKEDYTAMLFRLYGKTITLQSNDNISVEELLKITNSIKK